MLSLVVALAASALAAPARPDACAPDAADDVPAVHREACPPRAAPSARRLRPGGDACGRLHRRIAAAAARAWADELAGPAQKVVAPLTAEPDSERRLVLLWNDEGAGATVCGYAPQIRACRAEDKERFLAEALAADDEVLRGARDLYAWYWQARQVCLALQPGPDGDLERKLVDNAERFWRGFQRLLGDPAGKAPNAARVRRLGELFADYGSASLDLGGIKARGAALDRWGAALGAQMKARYEELRRGVEAKAPARGAPPRGRRPQ